MEKILRCRWCGSVVHFSDEQYTLLEKLITLFEDLRKTGIKLKFNQFGAVDAVAKCCETPDYWYIDCEKSFEHFQ